MDAFFTSVGHSELEKRNDFSEFVQDESLNILHEVSQTKKH